MQEKVLMVEGRRVLVCQAALLTEQLAVPNLAKTDVPPQYLALRTNGEHVCQVF